MNGISQLFPKRSIKADTSDAGESAAPEERTSVPGERGIASVNQAHSLQSRISNLMAMGLMGALGLGLLGWYYSQTFAHQRKAREDAQASTHTKAQGEMPLPSLGPIDPPGFVKTSAETVGTPGVLGGPPPLPAENQARQLAYAAPASVTRASGAYASAPVADRRLEGPVFSSPADGNSRPAAAAAAAADADGTTYGPTDSAAGPGGGAGSVAALLRPSVMPAVRARVLPTQQMLLPKGAFIDCTLETAIDSSLPGFTTCITATDTFGADGEVVLLERGTKLVGEVRGEVRQGIARVFVLWTEARTPEGVEVPLDSPATDELGRAGLPGRVNRHFWQRFGAAMLVSVIDAGVQAGVQASNRGGGTVVVNPAAGEGVLTEVLRNTIAIAPTVIKHQGDRIQVLVARDLDFRSVYALRIDAARGRR